MEASLFRRLKAAVALLCVALSFVFAGATAASVLDRIQHQDPSARHHQHMALSNYWSDAVHGDGAGGGDRWAGDEEATSSHDPGAGHHHHADNPTGIPTGGDGLARAGAGAALRLFAGSDDLIVSPGSPGPERPPRRFASRA